MARLPDGLAGPMSIDPPVGWKDFVGPEGHAVFSLPAHNFVSLLDKIDVLQSRRLLIRRLLKE